MVWSRAVAALSIRVDSVLVANGGDATLVVSSTAHVGVVVVVHCCVVV